MAYDEQLAERVREVVTARPGVEERKMFGGLGWMLGGNMACGLMADGLLVRIDPGDVEDACREPHVREFGFPGRRPMSGFGSSSPRASRTTRGSPAGSTPARTARPRCRRSSCGC
jgi:hypothetical protein